MSNAFPTHELRRLLRRSEERLARLLEHRRWYYEVAEKHGNPEVLKSAADGMATVRESITIERQFRRDLKADLAGRSELA